MTKRSEHDPSDKPSVPVAGEQHRLKDKTLQSVHDQLLREKEEPTEGKAREPLVIVAIACILCFWAGIYIANFSGGFSPDVYNPEFDLAEFEAQEAQNVTAWDPIKQGEKLFRKNCQQCHQATGEGVPGVYPPLVGSDWVLGSEDRLIKILLNGMEGPVVVKGNTYNGVMQAFGKKFDDKKLAALLTYVRASWGNEGEAVTELKVAEIRESVGSRTSAWTADELLSLHPN